MSAGKEAIGGNRRMGFEDSAPLGDPGTGCAGDFRSEKTSISYGVALQVRIAWPARLML